ncbi:GldG family protein [Geomonas sp. RF6]|uniref:GldG family protein n=1 Tax=Geomonas sp. RF6 TaxID=2897342 RepID=UPI001E3E9950|nr:GldG family protein [Geomonas sp. RF6]UFS71016.1 GldG family protein [Geomonas sp. RF6]
MTCFTRLMCIIVLLLAPLTAAADASRTVLFDNSHGERFVIDGEGPLQLSGLAGVIRSAGARVAASDEAISDTSLQGADALVISGAFRALSQAEIQALVRFMERGGKVAVMLHIAPPLATLLERLNIRYTNGVVQENSDVIDGEPLNFRVRHFGDHAIFRSVESFSVYGAWGLMAGATGGRSVAESSPQAWVDIVGDKVQRSEETAAFAIAVAGNVGKGGYIVFGDDALFQNKFLDENNKALAANLAAWLVSE